MLAVPSAPSRLLRLPRLLACLVLLSSAAVGAQAQSRCAEDDPPLARAEASPPEPRLVLQGLVRDALSRSHALGATRLLAEAARLDIDEVRAGKALQGVLTLEGGPQASQANGLGSASGLQGRLGVSFQQMLYDGGRTDRLIDWRSQLAEAARLGTLTQQEQIALSTVALALERSRYRQQVLVYGQYVRKMACLAEALETIVRADRGRASELVQARKSLQQAEIAQAQAMSQARQVEVRLRRLVGDGLPGVEGLSSALLQVPELGAIEAESARSSEIAALQAQAQAARQYAEAIEAGRRPQVNWNFGGSHTHSTYRQGVDSRGTSLGLGVTVSIPLLDPGTAPAAEAARKRAQAALLQREEALEQRRFRVRETHEQTLSAFDRAARVGAVLRDSEQVRGFTLQQWQQLGRRSLFDVMSAEADHYNLRVAYVNALHDGQQLNALLLSLGRGVGEWLN
jgi:outer membrane protein TolC